MELTMELITELTMEVIFPTELVTEPLSLSWALGLGENIVCRDLSTNIIMAEGSKWEDSDRKSNLITYNLTLLDAKKEECEFQCSLSLHCFHCWNFFLFRCESFPNILFIARLLMVT